ncbi:MAG: hypothetical protein ABWY77_03365 [Acidimicrobiia bacterium]
MTRAASIWIAVGDHDHVVDGHDQRVDDEHHGRDDLHQKPATSTTSALPPLTDNAQTYAEYLFAAWKLGDRTAAARVANADAVDQMFTQAYSPSVTWTFSSCGPAAGTLYCSWTGSPGGATLTIAVRTTTGGLSTQVVGVTRSS